MAAFFNIQDKLLLLRLNKLHLIGGVDMSSNGITAKEARNATEKGEYPFERVMEELDFKIKVMSDLGQSSFITTFMMEGLSQDKIDLAVSKLKHRGFKVEQTNNGSTYTIKVHW